MPPITFFNAYSVLGVSPLADAREIERAHAACLRERPASAWGRFRWWLGGRTVAGLAEARALLLDPARRAAHDEQLRKPVICPIG